MNTYKKFHPPEWKQFYQIPLSYNVKQILLGGLLGDGSLNIAKNYKNARYSERHSVTQEAYIQWKYKMLQPELKGKLTKVKPELSSFSSKSKWIYQSAVSQALTQLHVLTHKKNKKSICRRWLNCLDALGLAVWWCNNGSLNRTTQQGIFCTDGFSYKEHTLLARYLTMVWDVHCIIVDQPVKKNGALFKMHYRLRFATIHDFEHFFKIILPYIPVTQMVYKVKLNNQQRWISEMEYALPQFDFLQKG